MPLTGAIGLPIFHQHDVGMTGQTAARVGVRDQWQSTVLVVSYLLFQLSLQLVLVKGFDFYIGILKQHVCVRFPFFLEFLLAQH